MARAPRCYFSFRSPYSWLAWHDLTTSHRTIAAQLEWLPFWEPDEQSERLLIRQEGRFIYTPMSKEKHLYVLQDVKRLAQRRGLSMVWPVDQDPCWEIAHLAYFVAEDAGRGMAFIERVYRARWQEGRNICDRATIAQLADEVGVPGETASGAYERDDIRQRGVEALLKIERDSVFGVPFFINRSQKFWGVDRLDDFIRSLQGDARAAHDSDDKIAAVHAVPAVDVRTTDHGHAGGCG